MALLSVHVTGQSRGLRTFTDFATIKYDVDGNQLWAARYNGPGNGSDWPAALAVDQSGNVYTSGTATGDTGHDFVVLKNPQLLCVDHDSDGYGSSSTPFSLCPFPESDCNDFNPRINPGAEEDCSTSEDEDCDGEGNDWDADCSGVCADSDGDGLSPWGGPNNCEHPGEVDCDDQDPQTNPGAEEDCFNENDDDCDDAADFADRDCSDRCLGRARPGCVTLGAILDAATGGMTADPDLDGLSNQEELKLWWHDLGISDSEILLDYMLDGDVDKDGLPDGLEAMFGTDPGRPNDPPDEIALFVQDWQKDPDDDGVITGLELLIYDTHPGVRDSDGDGVEDGTEVAKGSQATDATSVPDRYGVILGRVLLSPVPSTLPAGLNGVEVTLSTSPVGGLLDAVVTDPMFGTDGAFVFGVENPPEGQTYYIDIRTLPPGGLEVVTPLPITVDLGLYPPEQTVGILLTGMSDQDADGVPDSAEALYKTDPEAADTDGDDMPDGFEIVQRLVAQQSGLPLPPDACCDPLEQDAHLDPDGDGDDNLFEYGQGTDPNRGPPEQSLSCPESDSQGPVPATVAADGYAAVQLEGNTADLSRMTVQSRGLLPTGISGRVTSVLNGGGLAGAGVRIFPEGCADPDQCYPFGEEDTLADGFFRFILLAGEYSVVVCRPGYYPGSVSFSVGTDQPSVDLTIPLRPKDAAALTAETWWGAGVAGQKRTFSADRKRLSPVGTVPSGAPRRVFVPLPVISAGSRVVSASNPGGTSSASLQTDDSRQASSTAFELEIQTQRSTGSTISRATRGQVARAAVNLEGRPGDVVTEGAPDHYQPDGRVTGDDVRYALRSIVGSPGYWFQPEMDVVDTGSLHKTEGGVRFGQDRRVTIEDALAILYAAKVYDGFDLPVTARDIKQPCTVRMEATEGSVAYLFGSDHLPFASAGLKGLVDVEILSYPLDSAGSAFLVKSFKGWTEDPIDVVIPGGDLVPVPVYVVVTGTEMQLSLGVGTITQSPGQRGKGSYAFEVRHLLMDVAFQRQPGLEGIPFVTSSVVPVSLAGRLMGGEDIDFKVEVHNTPEDFPYDPEGIFGRFSFTMLVNLLETERCASLDGLKVP